MASKRVKNRLYWVAVKATANMPDDFHSLAIRRTYAAALNGKTDADVLPMLEQYEAKYGTSGLKDVHKSELWEARNVIDRIRDSVSNHS